MFTLCNSRHNTPNSKFYLKKAIRFQSFFWGVLWIYNWNSYWMIRIDLRHWIWFICSENPKLIGCWDKNAHNHPQQTPGCRINAIWFSDFWFKINIISILKLNVFVAQVQEWTQGLQGNDYFKILKIINNFLSTIRKVYVFATMTECGVYLIFGVDLDWISTIIDILRFF